MPLIVAALVMTSAIALVATMTWSRREVRPVAMTEQWPDLVDRPAGGGAGLVRFGDVQVNLAHRTVFRGGVELILRPMEFNLLAHFVQHPEAVHSREALLSAVWHYQPGVSSRTVDVHVFELRRKLERDPESPVHFLTVRKVGYRFRPGTGTGTTPIPA
jgi:DNA-binding response OmpR family regulator